WAYSGYLLLLIGSIGLFILFLQHRLRMQHKIELEQKEAERLRELDSFRSKLYTNITHEFRTPLTVMLGTNQQLAATENNPERRRKFGLIKRNGNNLLDLVNQLLDLSKIEHNELTVNYVQGDFLKYVRYIIESFYSLANINNVLLQVESKEGEIIMDYDSIKIQQILSNLISNAIKYTSSGGKVTVSLSIKAKDTLEILVQDTGKGISATDLPHIFNRFYQANDDVAKSGGTGIGLALTQELVKLLKGNIRVESQLGKGTTFTLQLPISKQANFERVVQTTTSAPLPLMPYFQEEQIRQDKKEHRLLIIEDNPDVVEYLTDCLKADYQLSYAYNGQAGIEKALELIPDLIISDVMMPEKTGFEVTEMLKQDEKTSHIPIVLLTAKADIESKLSGLKRGADVYLAKPFHQEELLVQLRNLLQIRLKLQARYQALDQTLESQTESIQQEDVFITKIRQIVEENLDNEQFDVSALCKAIGMSRSQLHHKLKALTNRSTSHYVRSIRLHKAK
ncbi:MAG: ATP-binding protein, partial [Bacteroidota bacterium]